MRVHDCVQGSERWLQLRCGIITASNVSKIITPKTMKLSGQYKAYMAHLLLEWIIGKPILDEDETMWMRAGTDGQDQALRAYAFMEKVSASAAGFYTTDDGLVGASPDGLVEDSQASLGLVELKGRKPELHLVSLMWKEDFVASHSPQVQTQLWVDDSREWDDLNCFPLLSSPIPAFTVRCYRNDAWQKAFGPVFREFNDGLLDKRLWLEREFGPFVRVAPPQRDTPIGAMGITEQDAEDIIAARFPKDANYPAD